MHPATTRQQLLECLRRVRVVKTLTVTKPQQMEIGKWIETENGYKIVVCPIVGIDVAKIEKRDGEWYFLYAGGEVKIGEKTTKNAKAEALARVNSYINYVILKPWQEVKEAHEVGKAYYGMAHINEKQGKVEFIYTKDGCTKIYKAPLWHVKQQKPEILEMSPTHRRVCLKAYFERWIAKK